jgi:predicted transcriptional regulator
LEKDKKMRAKLGLTQDDLAKKADINYTTPTNRRIVKIIHTTNSKL